MFGMLSIAVDKNHKQHIKQYYKKELLRYKVTLESLISVLSVFKKNKVK